MKSMTKLMVVAMILAAALVVAPVAAGREITKANSTVYIGEENLNLAATEFANVTEFVHFTGEVGRSSIDKTLFVSNGNITELVKGIPTGGYYARGGDAPPDVYYINVQEPEVTLDVVLNDSRKDSVDGKSVTRNTKLAFKVTDNIVGLTNTTMDIEVTLPGGGVVTYFGNQELKGKVALGGTVQYIGPVDLSGAEAGTYTAQAKWPRNSDFYGKGFDSKPVTFEVSTKSLTITSDKDTVVRGNSFSVTITGESSTLYYLNVTGTDATRPTIASNQVGVTNYSSDSTGATVKTNAAGTRTVQLNTASNTRAATYTIEVKDKLTSATQSDNVRVRVEEGAVTITTSGTGTYYIGEEITLSGTCTDNETVYLFMTGPNLGSSGVGLTGDLNAGVGNFTPVEVNADDTWSYRWNTADINRALTSGGYTIYAVSQPRDRQNLGDAKYATATVQLRPGFITATLSGASVAKGEDVTITGTAQGNPTNVRVWIFGKNYYGGPNGQLMATPVNVESDGTFEFELDGSVTKDLTAGQYFVVVQHPMGSTFEVEQGTGANINSIFRANETGANSVFVARLTSLQASEAANALIDALESPYVNDAYTKLTFFLEDAWIRIDPIGDQSAGSTFTITGTTNLAAGSELIVEVTSAAFQPGATGETTGFSSDAGTVIVQQGETANTWSFEVDGTTFRPDQYIVSVESIEAGTSTTGSFNVVEGPAPTPTGTETTTPTGTETPTPTGTTTTEPTPTQSPGFGALVALAGLGAVAFLVLRRD